MLAQIPGVTVMVYQTDQLFNMYRLKSQLSPADDGYLGQLAPRKLLLQVKIAPERNVYGFTVDGQKKIIPKKNMAENPVNGKLYELKINTRVNDDKTCCCAPYPHNNLRLAEQLDTTPQHQLRMTGAVQIWEIAVISQHGDFFLTVQPTRRAVCFRYQEIRLYPSFIETWPQMNEYLVSLLPRDVTPADISFFQEDPQVMHRGRSDEGTVKWYNEAWGVGCLLTDNGAVRVHWSEIETKKHPQRAYLKAGEVVHFKNIRPLPQAGRGSAFDREAVGVTTPVR